jgi:serine/threonine protein kinase
MIGEWTAGRYKEEKQTEDGCGSTAMDRELTKVTSGELRGGRYKIEKPIGKGGMGRVFLARDTQLPRRVALKFVPPDCDPELLRRLKKEAIAAASISHPCVASVIEFEEHGQESFIVYEYVEGKTLRDRLGEHRFAIHEVIEVGTQLADALCTAHDLGIIHRDLKPENLMLVSGDEGRLRVKILDFGLAKQVKPLAPGFNWEFSQAETSMGTGVGVKLGTPPYMAPEQVQDKAVDSRTDLYALGLVLYEMITGVNPFLGGNWESTKQKIETLDPPPTPDLNPNCPPALDGILRRCLRKPKEERYQSAHEVLHDLRELGESPVSTVDVDISTEQISRGLARGLFVFIQAGYLAMYSVALCFPVQLGEFLKLFSVPHLPMIVFLSLSVAAALRVYFVAAAALDYPGTGSLFRRVFPLVLVLDAAWAASPLMLFNKLGFPVFLMMAPLACLPFSQRTLLDYAYAPQGGRISTAPRAISGLRA